MKLRVRRRPVKYARLEVMPDGTVLVTAPEGFDVDGLLERHRGWLEGKLAEIGGLREVAESGFPINGEFYRVIHGRRPKVHERFKTIVFSPTPDDVIIYLKKILREELLALLNSYAERMGVEPGKIYIRHQKSKWGSCSARGNLNFNVRLISLPRTLREYVVVHELAHLRHLNHSKAFWKLVGEFYPDYKHARKELKKWWTIVELNPYWNWLEGGKV
ncbi:MAG: M48 family metallopeptidase [Thermococcus sp.]|uniref:Peptidase n=1 Tax=Thermococcus guaymasensis DSM 11113 TaxID=1432656 RepID=A0A0X1KLE0_9EURY|nr:SprT family zinc-dependent metalloprotease [Thermococcus guaymasensis]AJC72050.1 peptidase [Thermococcus guaymasensis DSM 11113]MCD6524585.1 M48 family metallopeptidase [Thermococcus sp.]